MVTGLPWRKGGEMIDWKFKLLAVNPVNGHTYTEEDALVLCAKDKAVPAALEAYRDKCIQIGATDDHITSINMLIRRVYDYQDFMGSKIPDTEGAEVERCVYGVGII